MSRNDLCVCGSGKKQKKCHPDIVPDSRAGKLLALYCQIDDLINSYYSNQESKKPPCQKGCFSCCYHYFSISNIEFKLILKEIQKWSKEEIGKLRETVFILWKTLSQQNPDICENLEQNATLNDSILFKQILMAPNVISIPCPLLDLKTGSCRVYTTRPLVCRLHGTTTFIPGDFEVCKFITSNIENKKITPDASDFLEKSIEITSIIKYGEQVIRIRPYPIIYWLKLTFENSGSSIVIPEEARDFRIPSHIADRMEIGKYLIKE